MAQRIGVPGITDALAGTGAKARTVDQTSSALKGSLHLGVGTTPPRRLYAEANPVVHDDGLNTGALRERLIRPDPLAIRENRGVLTKDGQVGSHAVVHGTEVPT